MSPFGLGGGKERQAPYRVYGRGAAPDGMEGETGSDEVESNEFPYLLDWVGDEKLVVLISKNPNFDGEVDDFDFEVFGEGLADLMGQGFTPNTVTPVADETGATTTLLVTVEKRQQQVSVGVDKREK